MKKNIYQLCFLIFALSCTRTSTQQEISHLIKPQQFKEMMNDERTIVIDVRTPEEMTKGVIGKPKKINYRNSDFKELLLALDKSKTYLVYCKSGGRSGKTKQLMDDNGFDSVYDLQGGITAWEEAGLPVD